MILRKAVKFLKSKELLNEARMIIDDLKRDSDGEVNTIINETE